MSNLDLAHAALDQILADLPPVDPEIEEWEALALSEEAESAFSLVLIDENGDEIVEASDPCDGSEPWLSEPPPVDPDPDPLAAAAAANEILRTMLSSIGLLADECAEDGIGDPLETLRQIGRLVRLV